MSLVFVRSCLCLLLLGCTSVFAVPRYRITDLGFTDAEHTRADGKHNSSVDWTFSPPKHAKYFDGYSYRYNGGNTELGTTSWLLRGTDLIEIGLYGPEHTSALGAHLSWSTRLNEAGHVLGSSRRFNGGNTNLGESVWLFDGTTTHELGFSGGLFTQYGSYENSYATELNEAGQVAGLSVKFGSQFEAGTSAWIYDGLTTEVIGLAAYSYNYPLQINNSGLVIGNARATEQLGKVLYQRAWLYDGVSTIELGLFDAEHTLSNGYRESRASSINDQGNVIGTSERFDAYDKKGTTAWLYNGINTVEIGLSGGEHVRSDGYYASSALFLNKSGQVAGSSARYNLDVPSGNTAWLFDGTDTIHIGLTDEQHTREDGYRVNTIWRLNDAGYVSGDATRYYPGSEHQGQSSWLYDGQSTVSIGLTSDEYMTEDGTYYNQCLMMNAKGQVAGINYSNQGATGWMYDPELDQTFPLPSLAPYQDYRYSTAMYLSDDGWLLGTYSYIDEFGNNLGDRAFYFSMEEGMHDLGSLVDGGLTAANWSALSWVIRANTSGQIIGRGVMADGSHKAFLLTPIVPEPGGVILALWAVIFASRIRVLRNS